MSTAQMTPDQINSAYNALTSAVNKSAASGEAQVANAAAAKAPGLAVGPNAYDVGRYITPEVGIATTGLVTAAKQALLKKVLQDATFTAADKYTNANTSYQTRQRDYYRDQAKEAAARQRKADSQYAAQVASQNASAKKIAAAANVGGGGTVIVKKAAPIIKQQSVSVMPSLQGNNLSVLQGGGFSVQGNGIRLQ